MVKVNVIDHLTDLINKKEIDDIKNANTSDKIVNSTEGSKETKMAIKKCLEIEREPTTQEVEKYKDESTRRKFYNIKDLDGNTKKGYINEMEKRHINKIKSNNMHLQPEIVMKQNNSLQCLLVYVTILLKLWPALCNIPFSLDYLEDNPLGIDAIKRFRENKQKDVDSLAKIAGIPKFRRIDDVKNVRKYTDKKIIGFINAILTDTYDIKIVSNRRSGKYLRYDIQHNHPKKILYMIQRRDKWDDDFIV